MSACGGSNLRTFRANYTEEAASKEISQRIGKWPPKGRVYPVAVSVRFDPAETSSRLSRFVELNFPNLEPDQKPPVVTQQGNTIIFNWAPHFHLRVGEQAFCIEGCALFNSITVCLKSAAEGGATVSKVQGVIDQSYLQEGMKRNDLVDFPYGGEGCSLAIKQVDLTDSHDYATFELRLAEEARTSTPTNPYLPPFSLPALPSECAHHTENDFSSDGEEGSPLEG